MQITSRDNSLLRKARAVRDGKDDDFVFVEGLRLCEEALRSKLEIYAVLVSEELAGKQRVQAKIEEIASNSKRTGYVSEKLLESISFTKTPQGIVVLAQRPEAGKSLLLSRLGPIPLLLVLHEINNPVNVGAIIRTAEAGGVSGVVTTVKTSDPFSPKALRGAMGSAFRLPFWTDAAFKELLELCREN
ncbi:MAG TPA: RNA methyltransferase, partial [Pyrinomonadaceae bacterium]|nr:RNA methyltransferase [Pyrinomonadaceae bacterium]